MVATEFDPPTTVVGFKVTLVMLIGLMVRDSFRATVPSTAVILAVTGWVTVDVLTVNVADEAPLGTTTDFGGLAADRLLDVATLTPPCGAGPVRVTVPMQGAPPPRVVGFSCSWLNVGALIVKLAFTDEPTIFAVTRATELADTGPVLNLKTTDLAPAGMATDDGPPQARTVEDRLTIVPPDGAADPIWTVPEQDDPPVNVEGLKESEASFGAWMVSVAFAEDFTNTPFIVTEVVTETGLVLTEKVALVEPAGTVTEEGTEAPWLDELSATAKPDDPALADRVTVPVEVTPPATLTGDSENFLIDWAWAEVVAMRTAIHRIA